MAKDKVKVKVKITNPYPFKIFKRLYEPGKVYEMDETEARHLIVAEMAELVESQKSDKKATKKGGNK